MLLLREAPRKLPTSALFQKVFKANKFDSGLFEDFPTSREIMEIYLFILTSKNSFKEQNLLSQGQEIHEKIGHCPLCQSQLQQRVSVFENLPYIAPTSSPAPIQTNHSKSNKNGTEPYRVELNLI